MWPNKDFLYYSAIFTNDGGAEFNLNIRDKVPLIYGVVFALDVYARIHSHCNKESLNHFNSFLEIITEESKTFGYEKAIQKLDADHEIGFRLGIVKMYNRKETFIYKWSGISLQTSGVIAKIPFKASEINMAFALSRLLVTLSNALSKEKLDLLMQCFAVLSHHREFKQRKYNILTYNKIPKQIFSEIYSEGKQVWR